MYAIYKTTGYGNAMENVFLQDGTILNTRYELQGVIGSGGFGITYKAVDLLLNQSVAIKEFFPREWMSRDIQRSPSVLWPNEEEHKKKAALCAEIFYRESCILKELLDIPNIVTFLDYFRENETEYIVMKLIRGESLSEYAKKHNGTLPSSTVLSLFRNILNALDRIHQLGYIHRDISPGNLMLADDGELYLIDFGAATSINEHSELQSQQVFDHKGFEAPEHSIKEQQGPWSDIYSLCATMVYLISGEGVPEPKDRIQFDSLPWLLTRISLSSRQQNALIHGLKLDIRYRCAGAQQLLAELYGEPEHMSKIPDLWNVRFCVRTDTGSRKSNQDNFIIDTCLSYTGQNCENAGALTCKANEMYLAAVCDGVGGACYGDIASKTAVQDINSFLKMNRSSRTLPETLIRKLLDQLNTTIVRLGKEKGKMATTLSFLLWRNGFYYAVNIGDSPIYLLRHKKLQRLSTPHTRAELNKLSGIPLTATDLNTLMNYLGREETCGSQMAAIRYGKLQEGDTFLLCTDGVSKRLDEHALTSCLARTENHAVSSMWKIICRNRQNDNCTAVVLKF